MDSANKAVIINAALGGWYPQGQKRLIRSLNVHGYPWDVMTWCNEWPNDNYDKSCPYNVKAAAFEEAIKAGYTHIIWADCSMWLQNPIEPLFDFINQQGYYLGQSGFNCAQSCSDKCLEYFGITRDEAEYIPDCQSGLFGVYIDNPIAKQFIETWIQSAKDGAFIGSRLHDNQSLDPRFLFHRQDQSCASIIAGKLGMKLRLFGNYVSYYPNNISDVIFSCRGM